tara:strand:- start:774 stop:1316 length:543 start_codon:yes stop_codon:yes gene_type:complete
MNTINIPINKLINLLNKCPNTDLKKKLLYKIKIHNQHNNLNKINHKSQMSNKNNQLNNSLLDDIIYTIHKEQNQQEQFEQKQFEQKQFEQKQFEQNQQEQFEQKQFEQEQITKQEPQKNANECLKDQLNKNLSNRLNSELDIYKNYRKHDKKKFIRPFEDDKINNKNNYNKVFDDSRTHF